MQRYWFTLGLGIGLLMIFFYLIGDSPWAAAKPGPGGQMPLALPTPPPSPIPSQVAGTPNPTSTPGLPTPVRTVVPPCGAGFLDIRATDYYYPAVQFLSCRRIVSGYTCGGAGEPCNPGRSGYYRPSANTTRGQFTKMVINGVGFTLLNPALPTFADVPRAQPFYTFIETAAAHGLASGYACGGPNEPCDAQRRAYFHPSADITRGQLSKMLVDAKGWILGNPSTPTFADVPASSAFFGEVETAVSRGLISGYNCGGPNEPCDTQNRPYFRPDASASRGQLSKVLYLGVTTP